MPTPIEYLKNVWDISIKSEGGKPQHSQKSEMEKNQLNTNNKNDKAYKNYSIE